MKTRYLILVPYLLSCAAASPSLSEEGYVYETVDRTLEVSPGGSLSLDNTNGTIEVTVWDKKKVHIIAKKEAKAPTDEEARRILEDTEVRITKTGNHVSVKTKRDSWKLGGSSRLHVDYTVQVPRRFDIDVESVNGNVNVRDVEGRVVSETVNGNVDIAGIRGSFKTKTVNGSIRADLTGSTGTEALSAKTVNGGIRVTLPKDFGARVKARTVNGKIHTDFPITVTGRIGKSIDGKLNGGGRLLRLQTVNGSIRIKEGS